MKIQAFNTWNHYFQNAILEACLFYSFVIDIIIILKSHSPIKIIEVSGRYFYESLESCTVVKNVL